MLTGSRHCRCSDREQQQTRGLDCYRFKDSQAYARKGFGVWSQPWRDGAKRFWRSW